MALVTDNFGRDVAELVAGLTEPDRQSHSTTWLERKLPVLARAREGNAALATVICAAKISTIAAGNKMLYMGRPISDWSSGSLAENVSGKSGRSR